jgi:hypothetical protein
MISGYCPSGTVGNPYINCTVSGILSCRPGPCGESKRKENLHICRKFSRDYKTLFFFQMRTAMLQMDRKYVNVNLGLKEIHTILVIAISIHVLHVSCLWNFSMLCFYFHKKLSEYYYFRFLTTLQHLVVQMQVTIDMHLKKNSFEKLMY